ncbi:MAG: alpha/beta hydrolase [Chloroflexota bacterium]|nr:alpha/beta hydrolase [Chloroflexota bacterium]
MATFCLLHGDWHDGSCWDPLVGPLSARGHEALAPDMPYDDPDAGFEARARPALVALEGVSDQVVIVGHSASSGYAAFVAEATPGSWLVHLCPRLGPFPPPAGAPDAFRKDFPFPAKNASGATIWDAEAAIDAMYRRLPPETARALAGRLRPGAPAAEYPLPGHPDVPTALVYATEDEFFEPAWERFMAHELLGIEPIEIPGGHFPMVEDPEALADLLDRLVREHPMPS